MAGPRDTGMEDGSRLPSGVVVDSDVVHGGPCMLGLGPGIYGILDGGGDQPPRVIQAPARCVPFPLSGSSGSSVTPMDFRSPWRACAPLCGNSGGGCVSHRRGSSGGAAVGSPVKRQVPTPDPGPKSPQNASPRCAPRGGPLGCHIIPKYRPFSPLHVTIAGAQRAQVAGDWGTTGSRSAADAGGRGQQLFNAAEEVPPPAAGAAGQQAGAHEETAGRAAGRHTAVAGTVSEDLGVTFLSQTPKVRHTANCVCVCVSDQIRYLAVEYCVTAACTRYIPGTSAEQRRLFTVCGTR